MDKWYNTINGLLSHSTSLDGLHEIRSTRSLAVKRGEKLDEFIINGFIYADSRGQFLFIVELTEHMKPIEIYKEICTVSTVVNFKRNFHKSLSMTMQLNGTIPHDHEVCNICFTGWTPISFTDLISVNEYSGPLPDSVVDNYKLLSTDSITAVRTNEVDGYKYGPVRSFSHNSCNIRKMNHELRNMIISYSISNNLKINEIKMIPNRYGSGSYRSDWYEVHFDKFSCTVGWRKHVIELVYGTDKSFKIPYNQDLYSEGHESTHSNGIVHLNSGLELLSAFNKLANHFK